MFLDDFQKEVSNVASNLFDDICGLIFNCYSCKHSMIYEDGEFAGQVYGCAQGCCYIQPCKCHFYEIDEDLLEVFINDDKEDS